jgi:hypothetical protein
MTTDGSDMSGTFMNGADMITQLAGAKQVDECFALQQLRYSLGRVETDADACSAQQIYQAFSSGQFNLKQVLLAVVTSDSFRYRAANNAGSCQ